MKSLLFSCLGFFALLATACQNTAPEKTLSDGVQTEVADLKTAKQGLANVRLKLNDLRSALNVVPESVKTDTTSGFSEIMNRVSIHESKSAAMMTAYDQIIPEMEKLQADIAAGRVDAKSGQAQYDQLYLRFKGYKQGLEGVQNDLQKMEAAIAKLK